MNEALHLAHVNNIPKKLNVHDLLLQLRPFLLYKNVRRLRTIHLQNNQIESLTNEQGTNESIFVEETFLFEDNKFQVQTFLNTIEYIDLSNNAIRAISLDYFSSFPSLRILKLSCNQIFTFQAASVASLRVLDLSHNKITRVDGITDTSLCHTLEVLLLNDNCIHDKKSISQIIYLTALNTLDIRNNPIDEHHMRSFCEAIKDKCPCMWLLNGEMMLMNYENHNNKTVGIDLSPIQPSKPTIVQHRMEKAVSPEPAPIQHPPTKDILTDTKLLANLTAFAVNRSKKKDFDSDTSSTLIEREIEKMKRTNDDKEQTREKLREKARERMREKLKL
jgi:hypothetical protein